MRASQWSARSDDTKNFGHTILQELSKHGFDAVPVNPNETMVDGKACYPNVAAVPGGVEGAIVMVNGEHVLEVIHDCANAGVGRVWLFKGLGGDGAFSDEAVELCRTEGIDVVPGACPLMFLEPVRGFHKFHRAMRRMNGSLAKAS